MAIVGYNIYKNGVKQNVSLVETTEYLITGLTSNTNINDITVKSVDDQGRESQSALEIPTFLTKPAQVQNLNVSVSGSSEMNLTWDAVGGDGSVEYNILRGTTSGALTPIDLGRLVPSFVDSVNPATQYYYAVEAENATGKGLLSQEISATSDGITTQPPSSGSTLQNPTLVTLVLRGQSQMDGYLATPALTTETVPKAFALGPNSNGRQNFRTPTQIANSDLVPLSEYDINPTRAETPASAIARQILSDANDPNLEIVIINASQNATTLQDLNKDGASGLYETSILAIQRVKEIADATNKDFQCHIVVGHGGQGINPYKEELQSLITNYRTDVGLLTTEPIQLFADQQRLIGDPDYSIQIFEVCEEDNLATLVAPRYSVEYDQDNVHLTNNGSRNWGCLFGRAIADKLLGSGFRSLAVANNPSYNGSNINIPLLGVEGVVQGTGNYGLEIYNVTDSEVINGSFAISGSTIVFTPNTMPVGTKTIEVRAMQNGTGSLYSISSDIAVLSDSVSGNPYNLDKYLTRHIVSIEIAFPSADSPDVVTDLASSNTTFYSNNLTWTIPADNGLVITRAFIQRSTDQIVWETIIDSDQESASLKLDQVSYEMNDLLANTQYFFRIQYVNSGGSSISNTESVTTSVQPTPKTVVASLNADAATTVNIESAYPTLVPGDTLEIPSGTYTRIRFEGFKGGKNYPLTIINSSDGVVDVSGNNYGIGFYDANHINLTGTGSVDEYGFKLHPGTLVAGSSTGIGGYASGLEIDHCEIYDCGFAGFFLKLDLNPPQETWRENFIMEGLIIRDNFIHDVGGEGMYIGTTRIPTEYEGTVRKPHLITGVEIYNNILEDCGWDGIQVSRCPDHIIRNNTILRYGVEDQAGQNKGIAISNESNGIVEKNRIDTGSGSGIDCFGGADNIIRNNLIIDAGENGIFINDNTIEADYPGYEAGTTIRPGYTLANNTVVRCTVNAYQFNGTAINNKRLYNNIGAGVVGQTVVIANGSLSLDNQGNVFDSVSNLLFTDQATGDFTLQTTSPAVDAGIDASAYVTDDFIGTARPQGSSFDTGAYELIQVVVDTPPSNTVLPNITGNEVEGSTLTATDGTWEGTQPITYQRQWYRDSVSISGATSNQYTLVTADVGANIGFGIIGTNSEGSSAEVFAVETGIIQAASAGNPKLQESVAINTLSNGSSTNPRGFVVTYPQGYNLRNDYNLLIWWHGLGESGNGSLVDLASLEDHAINGWLQNNDLDDWVVIAPQSFNGYFGASRGRDFIEWALTFFNGKINTNSVHLAGLSAGGAGMGNLAENYPTTLAKLNTLTFMSALTGNGVQAEYDNIAASNVRTWWHHQNTDNTVGIGAPLTFYRGIVAAEGEVNYDKHRFTRYNETGHNAWTKTYTGNGQDFAQITGTVTGGGSNYYEWVSPETWFSWMLDEVVAVPDTVPSNLVLSDNNINENTTGIVGRISADGNPSPTFTITGGANQADFSINSSNDLVLDVAKDFETVETQQVEVTATNSEGSISQTFTINIVNVADNAPTDIILSSNTIDENNSVNNVVGTLSFTGDGTPTYTLVTGSGDTDNTSFNISGTQLRASEVFDFETKSSYSIRIQVSTEFGNYQEIFTITINDIVEGVAPTDIILSANTIDEENAIGDTVGTFSVDQGTGISYTLVSGSGDTDNTSFTISGNSLNAGEVFDFETKSSYSIRVRATNVEGNVEEIFTITINDIVETPPTSGLTIQTDFRLSGSAGLSDWNNLAFNPHHYTGTGELGGTPILFGSIPLTDINGDATSVTYEVIEGWNPIANVSADNAGGSSTGNNSGVFPDAVISSYHFGRATITPNNRARFNGLDQAKTYKLTYVGSRTASDERVTGMVVNGSPMQTLNVRNNTSNSLVFTGIVPDANGRINFNLTDEGANEYVYLNALVLEEE